MCIDRPDHVAKGKGPIDSTEGWEEIFRTEAGGWMAVADWLMEQGGMEPETHQEGFPAGNPLALAAWAKCVIVDRANYYGWRQEGKALVIYGEDDSYRPGGES